ncbi:MAG: hypothetical protein ACYTFX_12705 [Planctomycetota bacterium]|jgi:hypothetical protein
MDIDILLGQAREKAEGYGELYGRKETADEFLKLTYAKIYEDAPEGSVAERDAWVRRQQEYVEAISRKRDAYAKWKTAETYMKLLLAEKDVWQTKQANNRVMDKAHL